MHLHLDSEQATGKIAARLAGVARTGDVLALRGALGAGKTAFARAFIRARLGEAVDVPSPTFTLAQSYDAADTVIWHFDLYRLDDPDDTRELGFEDALSDGIVLIEWPERAGAYLPARRLDLTLAITTDPDARLLTLEPRGGDWPARLASLDLASPS